MHDICGIPQAGNRQDLDKDSGLRGKQEETNQEGKKASFWRCGGSQQGLSYELELCSQYSSIQQLSAVCPAHHKFSQ